MGTAENFRQYAADCVRQAEGEQSPEDKNILLNVALAWVRLAHQSQAAGVLAPEENAEAPPQAPGDHATGEQANSPPAR